MSRIHRNPRFVNPIMELLNPMVDGLMTPEKERLDRTLDQLIITNQKRGGTMNAFYYQGLLYANTPTKYLRGIQVANLDQDLEHEFEVYLSDFRLLKENLKRLTQAMSVILPKCRNAQQVRDAIPEALVMFIPQFRGMERMDPEGFLLRSNPMLHEQFQQAIQIALYYVANRIIY